MQRTMVLGTSDQSQGSVLGTVPYDLELVVGNVMHRKLTVQVKPAPLLKLADGLGSRALACSLIRWIQSLIFTFSCAFKVFQDL